MNNTVRERTKTYIFSLEKFRKEQTDLVLIWSNKERVVIRSAASELQDDHFNFTATVANSSCRYAVTAACNNSGNATHLTNSLETALQGRYEA